MSRTKILGGIAVAIASSWSLVVHAVPVVPVAVAGKHAVGLSGNYEDIYNLTLTDSGLAAFKATVRNPEYIGWIMGRQYWQSAIDHSKRRAGSRNAR